MAAIDLRALVDSLAGPVPTPVVLTAVVHRQGRPVVRSAGRDLVFPRPVRFRWDGSAWNVTPALAAVPAGYYWRVVVQAESGDWSVGRNVAAPTVTTAWADLVDVNPQSAAPSPDEANAYAARLEALIEQAEDAAHRAEAVRDEILSDVRTVVIGPADPLPAPEDRPIVILRLNP